MFNTPPSCVSLYFLLIRPNTWDFQLLIWEVKQRQILKLKSTFSKTMINYILSQKVRTLRKGEFNHYYIIVDLLFLFLKFDLGHFIHFSDSL